MLAHLKITLFAAKCVIAVKHEKLQYMLLSSNCPPHPRLHNMWTAPYCCTWYSSSDISEVISQLFPSQGKTSPTIFDLKDNWQKHKRKITFLLAESELFHICFREEGVPNVEICESSLQKTVRILWISFCDSSILKKYVTSITPFFIAKRPLLVLGFPSISLPSVIGLNHSLGR